MTKDTMIEVPERVNYNVYKALEGYFGEDPSRTQAAFAKQIGSSSTAVSKYLSGTFVGDREKFEARVADALKWIERRREDATTLFETNVTRTFRSLCERIRRTNDMGLIHGPAGVGKTCAVQLYLASNPTAIGIVLSRWCRDERSIVAALFAQMDTRGWDNSVTRAAWLVERLRNSNRLLIVDNTQRWTLGGREFVFDFYDATKIPIALVGNPEVLDPIKRNDQQFGRIGLFRSVTLNDAQAVAKQIVLDLVPEEFHAAFMPLATRCVRQRGALRTLRKHVFLALDFLQTEQFKGDAEGAFHAAHESLVTDYDL